MRRSDFYYDLPPDRIAQQPLPSRSASRLLYLNCATGPIEDLNFSDLPETLRQGDLLVFNDTQVIQARMFGAKESGGKVEILVERIQDRDHVLAQIRASKSPKAGARLILDCGLAVTVEGRREDLFVLRFVDAPPVTEILNEYGHVPLPPYINRVDSAADRNRYQTVYARVPGAVAAPTAGLHFDQQLLDRLSEKGIESAFITLHVGAGTFQPVRSERLEDHLMHGEHIEVGLLAVEQVQQARAEGRRVIAVGTTVARALESAARQDGIAAYSGETRLFITPGYRFQVIDALITNFHLPESTLLMLVCAFGGYEQVMAAYRHAIDEKYRFFSYGDAMLVCP